MTEGKSLGDALVTAGVLLGSFGSGLLVAAFYGALAGAGSALLVCGFLLFLTGAVASWRGR